MHRSFGARHRGARISFLRHHFGLLPWVIVLILLLSRTLLTAADGSGSPREDDLTVHVFTNLLARTNGSPRQFLNESDGSFVRNQQFWLRGLNGLTGTHVGEGPGATAITPWHVLQANHYKHGVGMQVRFADLAGHLVTKTVVGGQEIRPDIKSDIWLSELDSALPISITPMQLMPANWTNLVHSKGLPVAAMNQTDSFGSAALISFRQPVSGWLKYGYAYLCHGIVPALQYEPLRGGDSGHPIVVPIGVNLVVLGHVTFEPGGDKLVGPDYSSYASDIQQAITTLGTNSLAKAQKIRIVDLSQFR